jgi:flagellar motor switch protein FliG
MTPDSKANHLKISNEEKTSVFELLNNIDDYRLVDLLRNEEPKVIAAFLINLKPSKTGKILLQFPGDIRSGIFTELSSIGKISSTVAENMGKAACSLISDENLNSIRTESVVSS